MSKLQLEVLFKKETQHCSNLKFISKWVKCVKTWKNALKGFCWGFLCFFYFFGTLVCRMYNVQDLKTSFNTILNPNFNSIYKECVFKMSFNLSFNKFFKDAPNLLCLTFSKGLHIHLHLQHFNTKGRLNLMDRNMWSSNMPI